MSLCFTLPCIRSLYANSDKMINDRSSNLPLHLYRRVNGIRQYFFNNNGEVTSETVFQTLRTGIFRAFS